MKTIAFISGLSLLLFSCNNQKLEEQVAQLALERDEIKAEVSQRDASLEKFMSSFTDIEKNLREIREREMNIELARAEGKLGPEALGEKIKEDVKAINELLQQNRNSISSLSRQVAAGKSENTKLNRLMGQLKAELTQQITERETQIDTLKGQLIAQEVTIEELNTNLVALKEVNVEQDSLIDYQTESLNTAYYVMGTTKQLEEGEVIDREGGLLGLGRTKKLRDNFAADRFDKIDIRKQRTFPVQANKLELVTPHPSHAYTIEHDEEAETYRLVIADPDSFWESSKYLVMVTE